MHRYRIYRYDVHSQLPLAGLSELPMDGSPADVRILLEPVPEGLEPASCFEIGDNHFLMRIPEVGSYLVRDGTTILVEPLRSADFDRVRLYLLGSCMGALLYQRGLFPLHGCSVEDARGAVLFVGDSGAGKSTLADHFRRRGFRLLADDVSAVFPGPRGGFLVSPGFPQIRLCPDGFARLQGAVGAEPPARFDVDKHVISLASDFSCQPAPLLRICRLGIQEDPVPRLERLDGFESINLLLENLYRPLLLRTFATRERTMRDAARLAKECQIFQANRPWDATRIDDFVDRLMDAWSMTPMPRKEPAR
jgi:hypothetical protein